MRDLRTEIAGFGVPHFQHEAVFSASHSPHLEHLNPGPFAAEAAGGGVADDMGDGVGFAGGGGAEAAGGGVGAAGGGVGGTTDSVGAVPGMTIVPLGNALCTPSDTGGMPVVRRAATISLTV